MLKRNKMKNLIAIACLFFLTNLLLAQDVSRELSSYSELSVSGGIDVELHTGSPRAVIEVKEGDLDKLKTTVENGKLIIKFEKKSWFFNWGNQKASIKLYGADRLNSISVSAGAAVESEFEIEAEEFSVSASSGADIEIDLDASYVSANASSGAAIEINGHASSFSASASSGGSIEAHEFESRKVNASASSGGGIKVWVTEEFAASVSSGGSVRYKGNPEHTDIDSGKYSGGNVSRL